MTTGMSRRCGSFFSSSRTAVAVELRHQHVEQQHVEPLLPEQVERLSPVLCEHDGVTLLLEAAAEQEPVHPVVVGDEDVPGRTRWLTSSPPGAAPRAPAPASARACSIRARRPGASRDGHPWRAVRARGRARRTPSPPAWRHSTSACAPPAEPRRHLPARGRDEALRAASGRRRETCRSPRREVVAPELAQALDRGKVEEPAGAFRPAAARSRLTGRTRFSASASTSGRIGFAT